MAPYINTENLIIIILSIKQSKLVGLGGLELPTSPLSGVRSNQLSYRPNDTDKLICSALRLSGNL